MARVSRSRVLLVSLQFSSLRLRRRPCRANIPPPTKARRFLPRLLSPCSLLVLSAAAGRLLHAPPPTASSLIPWVTSGLSTTLNGGDAEIRRIRRIRVGRSVRASRPPQRQFAATTVAVANTRDGGKTAVVWTRHSLFMKILMPLNATDLKHYAADVVPSHRNKIPLFPGC